MYAKPCGATVDWRHAGLLRAYRQAAIEAARPFRRLGVDTVVGLVDTLPMMEVVQELAMDACHFSGAVGRYLALSALFVANDHLSWMREARRATDIRIEAQRASRAIDVKATQQLSAAKSDLDAADLMRSGVARAIARLEKWSGPYRLGLGRSLGP